MQSQSLSPKVTQATSQQDNTTHFPLKHLDASYFEQAMRNSFCLKAQNK